MPSMRESARKNLEKMVKGAAREVVSSRPATQRAGASASASAPAVEKLIEKKEPPVESSKEATSGGISKVALQQLRELIAKNGRTIQKVPVESIQLHENIRETYDETALKQLAESLEKDGLIQFPTLALKDQKTDVGAAAFICKNGHRRVLAAKSLGWKTIECVILPFASAKDELYHTIAANLREDVFYLDMAAAYQQAARLGESDDAIAQRSGVNPRTVGWYRRLTRMSNECQALAREHPELFNATWAVKLARQGELPPPAVLLKQMQSMIARMKAFAGERPPLPAKDKNEIKESRTHLKDVFQASNEDSKFAWDLVKHLHRAGYISPKVVDRLKKTFAEKNVNSISKRLEAKRAQTEASA